MMGSFDWPHRWFGLWSEFGPTYAKCPSIFDFVNMDINKVYPLNMLVPYLRSCPVVATTSRINFPNPFNKKISVGSISFRSNGSWIWLDDLADYVENYGVCIPDKMFSIISDANYVVPDDISDEISKNLDWPKI